MIHPTEHDIGRQVAYWPGNGRPPEYGWISSLTPNPTVPACVFVRFRGPTGELTRCDRLNWTVLTDSTLAIIASKDAMARYRRRREASRCNPPTPARGGFPYYVR